jgi:hypothetical protein
MDVCKTTTWMRGTILDPRAAERWGAITSESSDVRSLRRRLSLDRAPDPDPQHASIRVSEEVLSVISFAMPPAGNQSRVPG